MAVNPGHLLLAAGGGVFMYSGFKGKSVSSVFRQLAGGDAPSGAASANPITSTLTDSGSSSSGGSASVTAGSNSQNLLSVARYLVSAGYSKAAAAGVASCVDGESAGNPEAVGTGGAGLIGWTPPQSMTQYGGTCHAAGIGNNSTQVDFANQCKAIVGYNNANGNVAGLNAQTDPVAAADYYSQNFERPAVTDSDVRASVATQIYGEL